MNYTPSLSGWIEERLREEESRISCAPTDVAEARAQRREAALRTLRDDPQLDILRAGVKARLVEGERNERILRWLTVEVLTARIMVEAGR